MTTDAVQGLGESAPHTSGRRILPAWLPAACLLAILLLAFAIRLDAGLRKELVGTDEAMFLISGRNFWRGEGLTLSPDRPLTRVPGLQGIVAAGIARAMATDDIQVANAFAFAVFGALGAGMIFALARRLFDAKTGLLAAALYAVLPALSVQVHYWDSTTETLLLFLVLAGCYGFLRAYDGDRIIWAGAGAAAFGIAAMVRMDGFIFLGAMTAALILRLVFRQKHSLRAIAIATACCLAFFAAAYAPYSAMLWRSSKHLTPSVAGHTAAAYNPLELSENDLYAEKLAPEKSNTSLVRYVLREWPKYPRRIAANLWTAFTRRLPEVIPFYLFPFAGLALFASPETWRDRWRTVFLAATAFPVMAYMLFYVQARFLVVILPAFLIIVARGLLSVPWRSRAMQTILCVCLIVILIGEGRNRAHTLSMNAAHPEFRAAGKWIAAHSEKGDFLMLRKPEMAYYADRPRVGLPWTESIGELHAAVVGASARYVVFDEKRSLPVRPSLEPLLDVEAMRNNPWFEVVYAETEKGHRLVVLEPRHPTETN